MVLPTVLAFVIGAPLFAIVNLFHPVYWLVYPLYFVGVGIFILAVLATRSLDAGDLIFARSIENALNVKLSTVERLIQRFTEDTPQPLPSDGPGPAVKPITVIVPLPPSYRGGTEEYAYQVARRLADTRRYRCD